MFVEHVQQFRLGAYNDAAALIRTWFPRLPKVAHAEDGPMTMKTLTHMAGETSPNKPKSQQNKFREIAKKMSTKFPSC